MKTAFPPMRWHRRLFGWWLLGVVLVVPAVVWGQAYAPPDRESPGDVMIQAYLAREAAALSARLSDDLASLDGWQAKRPQYVEEYFYMLGLSPRPEKTPLQATVTGSLVGEGYVVEMLHYQSRPRLYVTANLYRPAKTAPGSRLPAVLYVCGHSNRGRNGNKVAYQSHGIWLARHGYLCLVVDSLQLGEIAAYHHGTYNLGRWWWHSRGYTPAGVEAWNGIRGIDYLVSRPDVDPERIAVTGISGGGAATFWIAAADERVKVAVPVSGMADLDSYITNRVINGHCDCMFFYNTFQWPWTRIAALVAPRPLLFVNSDNDRIFPMDANERIIARLERLYSLYGAGSRVDAVVSVGGHAYRQDIREAAYWFLNAHLRHDARPITDSEVDLVSEGRDPGPYPIPPEKLRVFPTDADIPADQLNQTIDQHFVPLAQPAPPAAGQFEAWRNGLMAELRRVSFAYFPREVPPAKPLSFVGLDGQRLESEAGIEFRLRWPRPEQRDTAQRVLLAVLAEEEAGTVPDWVQTVAAEGEVVVLCEPRGIGATRWTRKNPPNYVERSHALLGRTVDAGRIWDVVAAARYLATSGAPAGSPSQRPVRVAGRGGAALWAAYAAILAEEIAGVHLVAPPSSHLAPGAPQLLNVLRVGDVPDLLGLVAPRPLTLAAATADDFTRTVRIYEAAGARSKLTVLANP
jgi:dienelactone hydrolase